MEYGSLTHFRYLEIFFITDKKGGGKEKKEKFKEKNA